MSLHPHGSCIHFHNDSLSVRDRITWLPWIRKQFNPYKSWEERKLRMRDQWSVLKILFDIFKNCFRRWDIILINLVFIIVTQVVLHIFIIKTMKRNLYYHYMKKRSSIWASTIMWIIYFVILLIPTKSSTIHFNTEMNITRYFIGNLADADAFSNKAIFIILTVFDFLLNIFLLVFVYYTISTIEFKIYLWNSLSGRQVFELMRDKDKQ